MAEVTERDREIAEDWTSGCPVCEGMENRLALKIALHRESCVAEERAARLKAEGERDEALVSVSELRLLHQETERVNQILRERVADAERFSERDQRERRAALTGREAAEANLRHQRVREDTAVSEMRVAYEAAEQAEARLRAVIEAADKPVLQTLGKIPVIAGTAHSIDIIIRKDSRELRFEGDWLKEAISDRAAYRRVRDAQASPEPEASKTTSPSDAEIQQQLRRDPLGHEFCTVCGLPWSKHGGRDGR